MSRIIELLREVRRLQRIPAEQEESETEEAFEARVSAQEAEVDDWIGSLYYKANSVSWSHSKSVRYGKDLHLVWDALHEIGVKSDGQTHAANAIRKFCVVGTTK